jgi:acyl carrier protein
MNVTKVIQEVLEENAFIQGEDPFDPNITFQELNMDSLDITRFVTEVSQRFGVELDIEDAWPTTITELVNQIEKQIA